MLFFLQNGNWADRTCDEKHGFICMKQSTTESTGDEVNQDIGCKAVSEVYIQSMNKVPGLHKHLDNQGICLKGQKSVK